MGPSNRFEGDRLGKPALLGQTPKRHHGFLTRILLPGVLSKTCQDAAGLANEQEDTMAGLPSVKARGNWRLCPPARATNRPLTPTLFAPTTKTTQPSPLPWLPVTRPLDMIKHISLGSSLAPHIRRGSALRETPISFP
jgi:hypothetical protein